MKSGHLFPVLALVALAGCADPAIETSPSSSARKSAPSSQPISAGPAFYVMRHLQRGEGPDPALSAEGRANAERLAAQLAKDPPSVIYVSTTRRARETAAPLAASLGLTPREYAPADTPALIAAATRETGNVLIVGHSNTVADIVGRLGGARPTDLSESDYGQVWRIDRRSGETTSSRLGQ